ncbi:hypothetical protein KP509_34G063900 [Ceratopteris richardii]|uniref:Glycosyltransferase STELLO1 n=1 Tax=Ceratopteris richardii TaxID=49495 RepID=A0A8T2QM45_CERRI|nr:hypothetical protein KP509_34G063900 [Ceratopteris richardii]
MLVQEERSHLGNGVSALAIDKPESEIKINFRSGYLRSQLMKKDPALFSRKGTLFDYFYENYGRVGVVGLIFFSLLILILVNNKGDSPALLCIKPASKEHEANPFPNVAFGNVAPIKDTSRFHVVHADKWIVVAASGSPTENVLAMVKMQGWQVLAVGDSHTPANWDARGAIFLSVEQQAALKYEVLAHLPFTSHVRKSVGYLFAIQHGAKVIYDGDENTFIPGHDLNYVFDVALLKSQNQTTTKLLQFVTLPNRSIINPYIHFGQHSVWPRGLPLESVSSINPEIYYDSIPSGKQWIQQGIANGLPDVDSIFYQTRKSITESINIKFDSHAPPVAVPQGTMAPINHLNTLFHYPAFWALMLPVSVNPQVSDIFRGFWAQRLLWDIGGCVAIYPPSVHRIDSGKQISYEEEKDLHENAERLINFLVDWKPRKSAFFMRVLELSHSLAEAGFWTTQDVEFTAAWLKDLVSVGYKEPALHVSSVDRKVPSLNELDHMEFVPLSLPSIYLGVKEASTVVSEVGNLLKWRQFYGHIVLILECTWPVDGTALGWRMLYGRIFQKVVLLSNMSDSSQGVEANADWQTFKLLAQIYQRYPKAEGFLYMKDNILLNYWNLLQANKTRLWNLRRIVSIPARLLWLMLKSQHLCPMVFFRFLKLGSW